jgi:hypothetical protein
MAITVDWLDSEHTILKWTYQGQWTWDELAAAMRTQNNLLAAGSNGVAVIVDMRESNFLPQNIFANAKPTTELMSISPEFTVLITTNSYLKTVHNSITKTFPKLGGGGERTIVSTWDDALAVIAKKRGQQTPY